ncbi:nuclear pore complex protein Nup160-like isoform X1 [Dreissena polymorpha]|uniref:nuclear pore complex protein Nup160-like isoform X1 n=1 Tax=Dreissena polymorpha TaxID=45954 RepID=UPI002263B48F|nr:nuclear pore complex protein Nup160-like isoform X1 [Dreissena polymorpha]
MAELGMESNRLYREIYIPGVGSNKWKEIALNTGASASTLQDIKVAESCGGYTYKHVSVTASFTRNRFIYWKAVGDVLELIEESLDYDLYGSKVKFHFQDMAILGGVSVHESHGWVVVLVPTVASVHRLVFPHPSKLHRNEPGLGIPDQPVPSVFLDASITKCMDVRNTHMLNPAGTISCVFTCASSFYTQEGEALFALGNNSGNILLVKLPPLGMQGIIQQFELCQTSVMQKLWTGLVPSIMRGGQEPVHTVSSLMIQQVDGEACIFAVCKDHRLRVWSCKSHECLHTCNLLNFVPDNLQNQPPSGSGHTIRKMISVNAGDVKFGVHLNFQTSNQLCILQPKVTSARLQISQVASVYGPQDDLIDFCMTSSVLVSLWTSSEGNQVVRTLTFGDEGPGSWLEVLLEPPELSDLPIPPHRDPREVYLEKLFEPGAFSREDIRKALNLQVYSRSLDQNVIGEASLHVNTLRQDVTVAVETEIRSAAVDYEMEEEEYYQLQLEQWTKFYSCVIQYHEVGGKLKGLFCDSVTGQVGLIRKGCVTYLRPCDPVEEMYSGQPNTGPDGFMMKLSLQDRHQRRDLELLFEGLHSVAMEMSDDLSAQFEQELTNNHNLETVATQLVHNIILGHNTEYSLSGGDSIPVKLGMIHDLYGSVNTVLKYLDLSLDRNDEQILDEVLDRRRQLGLNHLLTSGVGVSVLSECVQQLASTRFNMLRDLYLLQTAALRHCNQANISHEVVQGFQNELLPYTASLLRAYQVVKWASQTLAVSTQATALEMNIRQLSGLDVSDSTALVNAAMGPSLIQKIEHRGASLLELFILGCGGEKMRTVLSSDRFLMDQPSGVWSEGLLTMATALATLIWPLSEETVFPEFLVGYCQYLPLQFYVSSLQHWCEFNAASRCFWQGLAYLHFDEPLKAAQCFDQAREGVTSEAFLRHKLLQTEETQPRKLEVLYYLKVIRQFEEYSAPDVVISLARNATAIADEDDENLPTLWSKVFKYQLELGHNSEAYNAMIENPDPSRRKDCLRQLLICLCEKGDLQSLVDFPYTDLQEEVENILESRARCMDLTSYNYYDLLYAFHIFRNNYRKGGSVMYEQGMRLGREVSGRVGLQRQAQCYLAALNALRLVRPEYSWIIKPAPSARVNLGAGDVHMRSPKHALDGEELNNNGSKFEILELHDIEKEYILVDARLRLLAREEDPLLAAGSWQGADEIVGLLVKAGMYDRAIIVSRAFDLPLNTVFESLALRCVNLAKNSSYHMRGDNDYTAEAWGWLKTNNLTLSNISTETSSSDEAWQLLQQYLDRYEDGTAQYHRCTANKLMAHGFALPAWFINSYKGLNSAELLRLYIDHDLLEEAVALCVEYIDAVMDTFSGQDCNLFQLKGCVQHAPLTVWLPYTSIDLLMAALRDHRQDLQIGNMYQSLKDKMTIYMGKVHNISEHVCKSQHHPMQSLW